MNTIQIFKKALLNKGLNFSTTLTDAGVTVRVFDRISDVTLGSSNADSLEEALVAVLVDKIGGGNSYEGLSRL